MIYLTELIYCPDVSNSTADSESYFECKSLKTEKREQVKSRWTWNSVIGGLLGFFVVFMGKLKIINFVAGSTEY